MLQSDMGCVHQCELPWVPALNRPLSIAQGWPIFKPYYLCLPRVEKKRRNAIYICFCLGRTPWWVAYSRLHLLSRFWTSFLIVLLTAPTMAQGMWYAMTTLVPPPRFPNLSPCMGRYCAQAWNIFPLSQHQLAKLAQSWQTGWPSADSIPDTSVPLFGLILMAMATSEVRPVQTADSRIQNIMKKCYHFVSEWPTCLAHLIPDASGSDQSLPVGSGHCPVPLMHTHITHESCKCCCSGYGSTDLRLYTSTKLKIVNYRFYSLMHKKQNLYLNNISTLYLAKIYFNYQLLKYWRILKMGHFVK